MADMQKSPELIAPVIRPVAEPRMIDPAYSAEQVEALFGAIRRYGPIRHILQLYVNRDSESETGKLPDPTFRGELASEGVCFDPAAEPAFYNSRFLAAARAYRGSAYAAPRQLAFNATAPCAGPGPIHVDAPAFRGLWHVNTHPTLLALIGQSGLFADFSVKMVQITAWFWRGAYGGFTYWPEGPQAQPRHVPPSWNRAILAENQKMFHAPDSTLSPGEQGGLPGVTYSSTFCPDPEDDDGWMVRAGDNVLARYACAEVRWMVHWSCILFDDLADANRYFDRTDDLTIERVLDTFDRDMRGKGLRLLMTPETAADPIALEQLRRIYGAVMPQR